MRQPEPGNPGAGRAEGYSKEAQVKTRSWGATSQQESVTLPTDHMHVHTATHVHSFCGPFVRFPRGRKRASYLKKTPQTQDESLTQSPER